MPPRTDDEVRADEARAIAAQDGAIERRAISTPAYTPTGTDVERAAERAVYRDGDGRRRIVGAGQPVPAGWTLEETADLGARVGAADSPTAPEDAGQAPADKSTRRKAAA